MEGIEVRELSKIEAMALMVTECYTRLESLEREVKELQRQMKAATGLINDIVCGNE